MDAKSGKTKRGNLVALLVGILVQGFNILQYNAEVSSLCINQLFGNAFVSLGQEE